MAWAEVHEDVAAEKRRIDLLLVEKGYFTSREKARAAIMAGDVLVNGTKVNKPGHNVDIADTEITIREKMPYVSRGGFKLARALQVFSINLRGKVVLDIGASTGGFTDCALQNGAAAVYAVDVGYGQMAWSLRNDPRVKVLERTNVRYMEKDVFTSGIPDFVTIDVSFISLTLVLPRVSYLLDEFEGVALVKPQFEAGREHVGKKGVVKDAGVHRSVLQKVSTAAIDNGIAVLGLDYSPVKGPEGNIEYLLYFQKPAGSVQGLPELVDQVVREAHRNLG
ncbi:TlyA family RNA methyltransferase [Desulfoscipio geothermicus]|uniref:TlyA family RNA methyltransferase n=1 Tax=Desulfoscipio geothermicus TaxID=39060 RepID=UPI001FE92DB8|nr:TlyA family RNA methyltransferase [Desulfoscipio geothermicus]